MASNSPIPPSRLSQICNDACDSALSTATSYDHSQTQIWNSAIINTILKALIAESSSSSTAESESEQQPRYKFAVNSTIIQHLSEPHATSNGESAETDALGADAKANGTFESSAVGRRGMHSASGAYWNNERDGMWSHKFEGGESKGMDIVISVMWIGV